MKRVRQQQTSAFESPDTSRSDDGAGRSGNDGVMLGGTYAQALRFIFIPHKVNREEPKLESIRRLCSVGTSFEELVLSWVEPQVPSRAKLARQERDSEQTFIPPSIPASIPAAVDQAAGDLAVDTAASSIEQPGYSITISRNDEMPFRSIGVIFERGEHCFGIACVAVDQVMSLYGAHERLNESTFSLSDSDGFTCDQEWFEKRNIRLGISEDPVRGSHIVPPSAIGELVLEYSLSTAGFARFAAAERDELEADEIEITFVFLGKDLTRGWHEEMSVGLGELGRHVKNTRSGDTPTLLI